SAMPAHTKDNRTKRSEDCADDQKVLVERLKNAIQSLNDQQKALLLSAFGEQEITTFLENTTDIASLRSIQYGSTHRINRLKKPSNNKAQRPVIEQRKVGEYLYKLQALGTGASYWYLQYTVGG